MKCVNDNTTATRWSGLTHKVMARFAHIVVFDGTSAYVIASEDLAQEIEQNEVEVLGKYADFDEASDFCDKQNDTIKDRVH